MQPVGCHIDNTTTAPWAPFEVATVSYRYNRTQTSRLRQLSTFYHDIFNNITTQSFYYIQLVCELRSHSSLRAFKRLLYFFTVFLAWEWVTWVETRSINTKTCVHSVALLHTHIIHLCLQFLLWPNKLWRHSFVKTFCSSVISYSFPCPCQHTTKISI